MKKMLKFGCFAFLLIICVLFVYRFIFEYKNKEIAGKYHQQITRQYSIINNDAEPSFYLPDEYPYYGRYVFVEDGKPLEISNDRVVSKFYFQYKDNEYYLYVSDTIYDYWLTYPDIYSNINNEKFAKLQENPEGYFVIDNYLYYAYGKNYYGVKTIGAFITGHNLFIQHNYKDYNYARLDLDTLENENIDKNDYEKLHDSINSLFTLKE